MGASTYIVGIRSEEGTLREMAHLALECDRLGVSYPKEIEDYFEGTEALEHSTLENMIIAATEVDLEDDLNIEGLVEGDVRYHNGAVIDLNKLPRDIKFLRVYMR